MKHNRRICNKCSQQIHRNHHWHLVESPVNPSRWELFLAFLRGTPALPAKQRKPEHDNCEHPQKAPATFVGIEHNLPSSEPELSGIG